MSDEKPELRDLAIELGGLTWADVMMMVVRLKVEYSELKKIEEKNSEPSPRLLAAMNLWLTTDLEATWGKVVKALRDINRTVLAKQIEDKYCRSAATPSATKSSTKSPIAMSSVSPEAKGIAIMYVPILYLLSPLAQQGGNK